MSKLHIIDDSTPISALQPDGFGRGLDLSLRTAEGYAGVADPFPPELLIPRSEWRARIEEDKARGISLRRLIDDAGLPMKDQGRTNYCWINAPVACTEIIRVVQNEPVVELSPASAGAQIKKYRNVGGWGKEGLEWIIEHGVAPVDRWPANAIDRRYETAENKAIALKYRVQEWWELQPRNLDQLVSVLLRHVPVAVGYNWWSHEVTAIEAVWLDGTIAILIRNSWGTLWQDKGYGVLQGNRMLPDDAVCPRTTLAS